MLKAILPSIFIALCPLSALSQSITLPAGTPLPVKLPSHLPMKAGEPIRAELLYPVYQDNTLILPARTVVSGSVIALTPNRSRRIAARLRADFTPYHTPVVRFDSIIAPDGTRTPIATVEGTDGAPIYRVVRTPRAQGRHRRPILHHRLAIRRQHHPVDHRPRQSRPPAPVHLQPASLPSRAHFHRHRLDGRNRRPSHHLSAPAPASRPCTRGPAASASSAPRRSPRMPPPRQKTKNPPGSSRPTSTTPSPPSSPPLPRPSAPPSRNPSSTPTEPSPSPPEPSLPEPSPRPAPPATSTAPASSASTSPSSSSPAQKPSASAPHSPRPTVPAARSA